MMNMTLLQAIPQMPELNFQDWMQNVGVFEEMMKGFLIGVLASAPMGPVGILTVQRTLNKGRWEGFATGVGASIRSPFLVNGSPKMPLSSIFSPAMLSRPVPGGSFLPSPGVQSTGA